MKGGSKVQGDGQGYRQRCRSPERADDEQQSLLVKKAIVHDGDRSDSDETAQPGPKDLSQVNPWRTLPAIASTISRSEISMVSQAVTDSLLMVYFLFVPGQLKT